MRTQRCAMKVNVKIKRKQCENRVGQSVSWLNEQMCKLYVIVNMMRCIKYI